MTQYRFQNIDIDVDNKTPIAAWEQSVDGGMITDQASRAVFNLIDAV